jgi:ABC-2 type transport system ATP-binding protein
MRQRLAIAATLLKEPELLILDEPTNGLDPQGILDIRTMIRDLGNTGVTVLVSSHILAEIEHVSDAVTIVRRGRLIASGSVSEVVGGSSAAHLRVRVSDLATAARVLAEARLSSRIDGDVLMVQGATDASEVTRLLAVHGLYVSELTPVRPDLESVFLDLTRDDLAPDGPRRDGEGGA